MEHDNAIILIILCLISLGYLIVISIITYGWFRLTGREKKSCHSPTSVSIIIPARNEENNILNCLNGLTVQDYPANLLEVIIVDDHSTDKTYKIATEFADNFTAATIKVFSLSDTEGKKSAIQKAMQYATGNLILCSDADCELPESWVSVMAEFLINSGAEFISGPVLLKSDRSITGIFQEIEFLSLVGSGAGAIAAGWPIMCNGANLGFSAAAYRQLDEDFMKSDVSSGDDLFLMLSMKRAYGSGKISFVKNTGTAVTTMAKSSVGGYINQRLRWVSKSRAYRDPALIFTAVSVFLMNAAILVTAVAGIFEIRYFWVSTSVLLFKTLVDSPLLVALAIYFNRRYLIKYIPAAQLLVVLFTTLMAILGNIVNIDWKGREVRN